METIKNNFLGIAVSALICLPAWFLGRIFPLAGAPVRALLMGMTITLFWKDKGKAAMGITFVSKKVLQWAVVLLGAGLNYTVILKTGAQSLPNYNMYNRNISFDFFCSL